MFYRILIDLSFHTLEPIIDIVDKTLDKLGDAIIINPGKDNEEGGFITTQQCFHDVDPTIPCVVIDHHPVID